jgi:hypothetical protein
MGRTSLLEQVSIDFPSSYHATGISINEGKFCQLPTETEVQPCEIDGWLDYSSGLTQQTTLLGEARRLSATLCP